MALLLRRSEIEGLVDLQQAIRVLQRTYMEQAKGGIRATPPLRLMERGIRGVAGGLTLQNKIGMRLSVTGGQPLALLFELDSGRLLTIMGFPFGLLRISATVGLALECLTKKNVRSVALIGSGRLAPCLIEAAVAVRPIETVRVYRSWSAPTHLYQRCWENGSGPVYRSLVSDGPTSSTTMCI